MSDEVEQFHLATDQLINAESNPMLIFKAAFSRLPVILLIGFWHLFF